MKSIPRKLNELHITEKEAKRMERELSSKRAKQKNLSKFSYIYMEIC
jgi:hypothetical protein